MWWLNGTPDRDLGVDLDFVFLGGTLNSPNVSLHPGV